MLNFTDFFKKRFQEFKKLPAKLENLLNRNLTKQGNAIIKDFKQGILNDSLGLARLTKKTIAKKTRQGFKNPDKPLVGRGKDSKASYANMMALTKIKNGVKIAPKMGPHWSYEVSLKKLYVYHEDSQRVSPPKRPAMQIVLKKYKEKIPSINIDTELFTVELKNK